MSMNINLDLESGIWRHGQVTILSNNYSVDTSFEDAIYLFFTGEKKRFSNNEIAVCFNENCDELISLQHFKPNSYKSEIYAVNFSYELGLLNQLPSNIYITNNDKLTTLFYLPPDFNRIFSEKKYVPHIISTFNCCYKNNCDKIVFYLYKLKHGNKTTNFAFSYDSTILNEIDVLSIIKEILVNR